MSRSARSGFSLVEVLCSLALLTTVLTAFMSAANIEMRFLRHQTITTQAIALLDSVTEELLLLNAGDAELTGGAHTRRYDRQGFRLADNAADPFFIVRWEVSSVQGVANIRRLDLSATWRETGTPQSLGWTTWRN